MRRIRHRHHSGYTLVESLMAMLIVAMTATVLLALVPMSSKTGKMVGNYQQASSLIQHKVDQMRGVGYGRLNYTELRDAGIIDATPSSQPWSFRTVDNLSSIYPTPTGTITVVDESATIRRAVVNLQWTGSARRQGNGSMSITVRIAKN